MMYLPEKHLCKIGKALEADWDNAVENFKRKKTEENKAVAYKAAYLYFHHRSECLDCEVFWSRKSTTATAG